MKTGTHKELAYESLSVDGSNVRAKEKADDGIAGLAANIKTVGLLHPLIVRSGGSIAAGRRRFFAIGKLIKDGSWPADKPVPVVELPADADVVAISLAENEDRSDLSPIAEAEAFAALVKAGAPVDEVAAQFARRPAFVRQRIVLARLVPAAKALYAKGDITLDGLQALTIATPKEQKAILAARKKGGLHHIGRWSVKSFLRGGGQWEIESKHALFDVGASKLPLFDDLFDNEGGSTVKDADTFWKLQDAAINEEIKKMEAQGWTVIRLPTGEYFSAYEYEKTPKAKGGKVFVQVCKDGQVVIHKGYKKPGKSAAAKGEGKPRPELTVKLEREVQCAKTALVQAALVNYPRDALCLLLAHLLTNANREALTFNRSSVSADGIEAIEEVEAWGPVQTMRADIERAKTAMRLPAPTGDPLAWLYRTFFRLKELVDSELHMVAAIIMATALPAGNPLVDALGDFFDVSVAPEQALAPRFLNQIRNKSLLVAIATDCGIEVEPTATMKALKVAIAKAVAAGSAKTPLFWHYPPEPTTLGTLESAVRYAEFSASYNEDDAESSIWWDTPILWRQS